MESDGKLLTSGGWRPGEGAAFTSTSPADGATVWTGRAASPRDVGEAVEGARRCQPAWADRPLRERAEALRLFASHVKRHADPLARLVSTETGKLLGEARAEVAAVSAKIDITIDAFNMRRGVSADAHTRGVVARTTYRPIGVFGVLGPFNFPAHLPNGHIVPALLAGNAVVFKPSDLAPATGELLVRLLAEAVDPGLVALVQGGGDVGRWLADPEHIDGILFTGGVKAGLALAARFGPRPDRMLALELGGNNPLVVDTVRDVDAAVRVVATSAYASAGQRCTCARRLILTDQTPRDFLDRLADHVGRLRVGRPDADPQPDLGPLVNRAAAAAVLRSAGERVEAGAEEVVACRSDPQGPAYVTPGLYDVTDIEVPDEEVFGPLLQVIRTPDLGAAVTSANATRFGLAAGFVGEDDERWAFFRDRVRAGIVNRNQPLVGASSRLPFGGIGLSGNFRPSGSFAIHYCNYPVASLEKPTL